MVEGAHSLTPDLWIHQESVVLIANTHDVWSFTPEFLLAEGIVPDTWQCLSASRGPDEANVHYGSVNWRMTENQLWISVSPDSPVSEWRNSPDAHFVSIMAKRYLERVPYLPFQRAWFYWNVSAPKTEGLSRMLENLLPSEWPEEFEVTLNQARPLLQFTCENIHFQIGMQNLGVEREGRTFYDSIVFNCYTFSTLDQPLDHAIAELDNWSTRWQTLQRAIQHLTGEMEP